MKKRLILAFAALAMALTLVLPASASGVGSASARQFRAGLIQFDTAYVYIQLGQNQLTDVELQLKVNEAVIPQLSSGYVREGDKPVHYMLLVDCSGTVRDYKEDITAFACSLFEETVSGGASAAVSVAGLGDGFRIIRDDCSDASSLRATMDSLRYSDGNTDLFGGIQDALEYIKAQPHAGGELYELVLVTDGIHVKPGQRGLTDEELRELETGFDARQDIIFHTYGLGEEWESQALNQAELGRGCHLSIEETLPETAAESIAGFTNSLYQGVFRLDAALVPAEGGSLRIQVLYSDQPGGSSVVDIPALGAAAASDPGVSEGVPPAAQTPAPEGAGETPGTESAAPESAVPGTAAPGTTAPESTAPGAEGEGEGKGLGVWLWLLIPVVAILILAIALLSRRASASRARAGEPKAYVQGAARIRIRVERGRCLTRGREFSLAQELIVGSSRECGLVFDEPEVAARNSRISVQDGNVYIEDLGSPRGTSIGGMRIYAPNRLRSGDVVSIGTAAQFHVEFIS